MTLDRAWHDQDVLDFAARRMSQLRVTGVMRLVGGYWNDVLRLETDQGDLVLKHYVRVMQGSLFPNLPDDEARALQRLSGRGVAPELVGFWPKERVLVYRYVAGPQWYGDVGAVAALIRRLAGVDASGFRKVPMTAMEILDQGQTLFSRCDPDDLIAAFQSVKPVERACPSVPASLIHSDIGPGNLIGTGGGLRLIDWQCPAAGDPAEDVASFLSPAFQILSHHPPLSEQHRSEFLAALDDKALLFRLAVLEPAFAWRMAGYCCLRLQTADGAAIRDRYSRAATAELARLEAWAT